MSVSSLEHLSLIEFYLWDRIDIPLRGSTAILGGNRTGKSCLLDAIQTGLTGANNEFLYYNASAVRTGRKSDRTLAEYCLGVVQHDEKDKPKPMRSSASSWIALGFRRANGELVTGLVHAVVRGGKDRPTAAVRWMIVAGKIVDTSDLVSLDIDGQEVASSFGDVVDRLRTIPGVRVAAYENSADYVQMLLVSLSHGGWQPDAPKYLRAVRRALKFEPVDNVTAFMREHILEAEPIDIERMRERLTFYRELKTTVEALEQQVESLRDILLPYDEAEDYALEARGKRAAAWIGAVGYWEEALRQRQEDQAARLREEEVARRDSETARLTQEQAVIELDRAKRDHADDPLERQIAYAEGQLQAATKALGLVASRLGRKVQACSTIQGGLSSCATFMAGAKEMSMAYLQLIAQDALRFQEAWASGEAMKARRLADDLQTRLAEDGDAAMKEAKWLKRAAAAKLDALNKEQQRLQALAAAAGDHASLSEDARRLRNALTEAGIHARMFCDVVEIKPEFEAWRASAEAVFGGSREAFLVDADQNNRAIQIQRQLKFNRPIEIVKAETERFAGKDLDKDSLATIFATDDPIAKGFIAYIAADIRRVETVEELRAGQKAVTKDLMRASPVATLRMVAPRETLIGRQGRLLAAEQAREILLGCPALLKEAETIEAQVQDVAEALQTLLETPMLPALLEELDQSQTACENHEGELAHLKAGRTQDWGEESKRLEDAKKAALARWREADLCKERAGRKLSEAEAAVRNASEELRKAQEELQNWRFEAEDPAIEVREARLAELALVQGVARLKHIEELRRMAQEAEQRSRDAARDADDLWSAHFKRFPKEALPQLPAHAQWQLRYKAAQDLVDLLSGSVLLGKQREVTTAWQRLAEVFKHEFVGRLVKAFADIQHAYEDLNDEVRDREFYGECYLFTKHREDAYGDIIELVEKAADPNWDMPLLLETDRDSVERRALDTITAFIEQKDDERLRGLRDPKAYWRFDTSVISAVTGEVVSNLNRRMRSGSGGEGQIPQYIAVVAAVIARALSPRRDKGALPLVLLDEAFSQLDVLHTQKIMQFIRELGLQVILAAPDGKTAQIVHGVDTILNVLRYDTEVTILPEQVTDELRAELLDEDPRLVGFAAFKAASLSRVENVE